MATMVKEKRREKKKSKEKPLPKSAIQVIEPTFSEILSSNIVTENKIKTKEIVSENVEMGPSLETQCEISTKENIEISSTGLCNEPIAKEINIDIVSNQIAVKSKPTIEDSENTYQNMNLTLERIAIPSHVLPLSTEQEQSLESPNAYLRERNSPVEIQEGLQGVQLSEPIIDAIPESKELPTAPMLEVEEVIVTPTQKLQPERIVIKEAPKILCMTIEQAEWMYGGEEMAEVKMISEQEEAAVQAGPLSGPEHPLVDLLSTLRRSHICLERDKRQLLQSFNEEERFRSALWRIEKRSINESEFCQCGLTVRFTGTYEHAEFLNDKLPVAQMKLTVILREIQESYCHHQHAALLAFYQIEEFIAEVVKGNKGEIRESLSLVLQALQRCEGDGDAGGPLATQLQRWARALAAAMLDARDIRQLLFLLHYLFRQTRSVFWATRIISLNVNDHSSAARAIAIMNLIFARTPLESALEANEESEEAWEEVGARGGGGAVGDGALRERDLLAVLRALPTRQLVAHVVLFTHPDVRFARETEWGDRWGGAGVLKASSGVRSLLACARRALHAHPHYARLHAKLRHLCIRALHALAGLHVHSKASYNPELREKVSAELEACFVSGAELCPAGELRRLPAALLSDSAGKGYCIDVIFGLHSDNKLPRKLDSLPMSLPALSCAEGIRLVSQASADRRQDHELARLVLEYLLQVGFKKKSSPCPGGCAAAARETLPLVLDAHLYLYTIALHLIADMNQGETLDPVGVKYICMSAWKPSNGEVRALLDDWAKRCPGLLPHLLLQLDYTPHIGLSLESQLSIGWWVCTNASRLAGNGEWAWPVLRRLRTHRACWAGPPPAPAPAPAPEPEPEPAFADLLAAAFALHSSSWGHSIPLICSKGAAALCRLATARPADAVHCLAPVMVAMAASPDSFAHAPKFAELFDTLLSSGPSVVQRALGLGGASGAQLLHRLVVAQLESGSLVQRRALLAAWLRALCPARAAPAALLDSALLAARDWRAADAHFAARVQESTREEMSSWCKHASCAPQVVECVLRAVLVLHEQRSALAPRLHDALHAQRTRKQKINVDAALQQVGASMRADELVLHRAACAALAAPQQHPAHVLLWRLFMQIYLQRPPCSASETTPPIGPLFFSGIMKSRTLSAIKKRLHEATIYHDNERKALTSKVNVPTTSNVEVVNDVEIISTNEEEFLPGLTIKDFTGESSDSDSISETSEEEIEEVTESIESIDQDVIDMAAYHEGAYNLFRTYARWMDEGDKVRAMPHQADVSKFIPEEVLPAAYKSVLAQRKCNMDLEPLPLPEPPPPPPKPEPSVFETVVRTILSIRDRSLSRKGGPILNPVVGDLEVSDAPTLLNLIDIHLKDVETYAGLWRKEVSRITSLDTQLWELVRAMRVSRALPTKHVACANKCTPVAFVLNQREWCISLSAVNGVAENRSNARAAVRRLTRPSRAVVRASVALQALAKRVGSATCAQRAAERAWRGARVSGGCAPAHQALRALLDPIAQRWISNNGPLCAELLSQWGTECDSLQQELCGVLLEPRQLQLADAAKLYTALLALPLSPHRAFSYLSKFEVNRWAASSLPADIRRSLLEALTAAVTRHGADPSPQYHIVLELLGVHASSLLDSTELCPFTALCCRSACAARLPPQLWPHVARAAHAHAASVPSDQLGHLLRELGGIWWEARRADLYSQHAPHVAPLLQTLHHAFVESTVALSYTPERVALYAWSGAREAWAPWLATAAVDDSMLDTFVAALLQTMADCSGVEEHLLGAVWLWVVGLCLTKGGVPHDALLRSLTALPFTQHQWLREEHIHMALQVSRSLDTVLTSWCCETLAGVTAEACIRDVADEMLALRLAALASLFTAPNMRYSQKTLDEACRLPWWRLPEMALEEVLGHFFVEHYNVSQPYHDAIHFRVILSACELTPSSHGAVRARDKRARGVSSWQRAACEPRLREHVPAHCRTVLAVITDIAPYLEESDSEVVDLLSRAVVIMCIDTAAAAALAAWQQWLPVAPLRLVRGAVRAASVLTVFEPYAALADDAAKAIMKHPESCGWSEIISRWARGHWRSACALGTRARPHAAYATALAHAHAHADLRSALLALLAADINFIENEAIIAVWICFACRTARTCEACTSEPEANECASAARALLARWAEPPRRSLLQMVGVTQATGAPTARHRVLSSLALCVLTPGNETAIRAFENAYGAAGALAADASTWGRDPRPKRLPRLAIRLFPSAEKYFKEELDFAPEDI